MTVDNQPLGRMTVLSLPEHLRGDWPAPQEIEVRIAGELVIFGLTTGTRLQRLVAQCANPECEGSCHPKEFLDLEIEIAPTEPDA